MTGSMVTIGREIEEIQLLILSLEQTRDACKDDFSSGQELVINTPMDDIKQWLEVNRMFLSSLESFQRAEQEIKCQQTKLHALKRIYALLCSRNSTKCQQAMEKASS